MARKVERENADLPGQRADALVPNERRVAQAVEQEKRGARPTLPVAKPVAIDGGESVFGQLHLVRSPCLGRHGGDLFSSGKGQMFALDGHDDMIVLLEPPGQDPLGQGVLHLALDRAAKGPGAVDGSNPWSASQSLASSLSSTVT